MVRGGTALSRVLLAVSAVVWAALTSAAVSAADAAPNRAAEVAELTRLSDAWDKAIVRKDRAAVAGNMAEDFRSIDGSANVQDKAAFVDELMDAKLTIDPHTVEDFEVRIFGDTALLHGRTRMTGKFDGAAFESNYRYIDIYVKRNGAWKIVSVQITRIPKA